MRNILFLFTLVGLIACSPKSEKADFSGKYSGHSGDYKEPNKVTIKHIKDDKYQILYNIIKDTEEVTKSGDTLINKHSEYQFSKYVLSNDTIRIYRSDSPKRAKHFYWVKE